MTVGDRVVVWLSRSAMATGRVVEEKEPGQRYVVEYQTLDVKHTVVVVLQSPGSWATVDGRLVFVKGPDKAERGTRN